MWTPTQPSFKGTQPNERTNKRTRDEWNGDRKNNPNIRNCSKSNHEPDKSRNSLRSRLSTVFHSHHKKFTFIFLCAKLWKFFLHGKNPMRSSDKIQIHWVNSVATAVEFCCHRNFSLTDISFVLLSVHETIQSSSLKTTTTTKNTWKLNFKDAKECVISPLSSLRFIKVGGYTMHDHTHTHIEPHRNREATFSCPCKNMLWTKYTLLWYMRVV